MSEIGKWTVGKLKKFITDAVVTAAGHITSVVAGDGLSGGGSSGEVTIDVDYAGSDSVIGAATDGTTGAADDAGITVNGANDELLLYEDSTATVKKINVNQLTGALSNNHWTRVENYSGTKDATYLTNTSDKVGIGTDEPSSSLAVRGNLSVGGSYFNTAAPSDGMIVQGDVGIGASSVTSPYGLEVGVKSIFTDTVNLTGGVRIYDVPSSNIVSDVTSGTRLKTRTTLGGATAAPSDVRVMVEGLEEEEVVRLKGTDGSGPIRLEYSGSADDDSQIRSFVQLSASTDTANSEVQHVVVGTGGEKTSMSMNVDSGEVTFGFGVQGESPLKVLDGLWVTTGSISGSTALLSGTLSVSGAITAYGITSGSIAGAGSYVGLNSNNQLVLTASAGGGSTSPGGSDTQIQYNNGGSFGGVTSLTYNDSTGDLTIKDDKKLTFGDNGEASIHYNEDGNNRLIISGSASGIELTGNVYLRPHLSGAIAGLGSYLGLDVHNNIIMTSSVGTVEAGGSSGQLQYNNDGAMGGTSNYTFNGTRMVVADDIPILFGSAGQHDSGIWWDGGGATEGMEVSSSKSMRLTLGDGGAAQEKLYFSRGGTDMLTMYLDNTTDVLFLDKGDEEVFRVAGTRHSLVIPDDREIIFGTNHDGGIRYDEKSSNRLIIQSSGSMDLSGTLYAPNIPSGTLAGSGSYVGLDPNGKLVLTSSGDLTFNGSTANGVVTYGGPGADVESNLTFDGSTLAVTGDITATTTISASLGISGASLTVGGNVLAKGNIDTDADDTTLFSSLGENTLTVGGATSISSFPGTASIAGNLTASNGLRLSGIYAAPKGTGAGADYLLGLDTAGNLIRTSSVGGGDSSPTNANYILFPGGGSGLSDLSHERTLAAGPFVKLVDYGANSDAAISGTAPLMTVKVPMTYIAPAVTTRVYFMGDAPDDQFDTYGNYISSKDIPEPGVAADFGYDAEDWGYNRTGVMVIPKSCTLVTASYQYLNRTANASCTRVRWAIMKLAYGKYAATGGIAMATTSEPITMYYEDIVADSGSPRAKSFGRTFGLTGSASHLTCSTGDLIIYAFETFGASGGAGYLASSLVFELDEDQGS